MANQETGGSCLSLRVGSKPRGLERMADRSRMNGEIHVRLRGGLEVKLLRSTRRACVIPTALIS